MTTYYKLFLSSLFTLICILTYPLLETVAQTDNTFFIYLHKYSFIYITISISWFLIELLGVGKTKLLSKFDLNKENNLTSRKVYTKINLLEKILIFVIILFAIGFILLSFNSIREIGLGIFASAGLAGIILGLSAQKIIGTLLAGVQIAITEPFRIDDAVVVEGEWGWIEEINLTYVVVRVWDKRRLVLPTTYFLEKPFQNWTRNTAEIIGTVFIYTDYSVSFSDLRTELTRLLNESLLWDKQVNVLQVTESKEFSVEIRILVSAKDSPTTWDLRVEIREKMIEYIQKNNPGSFPKTRVQLNN